MTSKKQLEDNIEYWKKAAYDAIQCNKRAARRVVALTEEIRVLRADKRLKPHDCKMCDKGRKWPCPDYNLENLCCTNNGDD